jgi:ribosome recycling factor
MSAVQVISEAESKMGKAIDALLREFNTVRTGRANPALLDKIEVEYYGTPTPLRSLANISSSDGRSLLIQPYDKSCLKDVEQAINKSELGLTPNNEGTVIRIVIPSLTEERRKELIKIIKKFAEDARVAIRNIRRECVDQIKKLKGTDISEDELQRQEESLQKLTDKFIKDVDRHATGKEADLMEV